MNNVIFDSSNLGLFVFFYYPFTVVVILAVQRKLCQVGTKAIALKITSCLLYVCAFGPVYAICFHLDILYVTINSTACNNETPYNNIL